jgi:hypothetical protein
MPEDGTRLSSTTSLCPTCLEPVPGRYEARDGGVHLSRTCPEHGTSSRQVWASLDHWEWAAEFDADDPSADADDARDPTDLDLTVDDDHACLAVIEVTSDCNLSCSFCFASSGPGGTHRPFDEVVELLETVDGAAGPRPIQFSGGEPTVRDDLPELVERAREMGFGHVEVNTNGLRLAREDGYAERLVDAGVSAIYLQFDGLEAGTYEAIRGVDLADAKRRAIEACRAADLPVVLVPTVVPGTNDHELGAIVRFALANLDVVQSVNFQPVSQFGRYDEHGGRFSIDAAARRLADQLAAVDARDLLPVPCCSTYCQFATALAPDGEGGAIPLTQFLGSEAWASFAGLVDEADWMEFLAKTPTGRDRACTTAGCCGVSVPGGTEALFDSVLPVTFTGFMDADAADVDRLEDCCLSVPTPSGDLVPFCAYNMTDERGRYAIRNRNGWGGRAAVDEPPAADVDVSSDAESGCASGTDASVDTATDRPVADRPGVDDD